MNFAVVAPNVGACARPQLMADLARAAEDAGWDGFFMWDTIEYGDQAVCDTWIALSAVASATRRVRLGTLVLSMARRRPGKVAREAVTLDHLSGGRVILGVGAGYETSGFTKFGESADPKVKAERLDEGLQILTGLWSGERFSFHGRHYTVQDVRFLPRPVNGTIPIWIAANKGLRATGPLRRAARYDGVLGDIPVEDVEAILSFVRRHRPTGAPFDVVVSLEDPNEPLPTPDVVERWERTGVTWLRYELDSLAGASLSLDGARQLVVAGPPR